MTYFGTPRASLRNAYEAVTAPPPPPPPSHERPAALVHERYWSAPRHQLSSAERHLSLSLSRTPAPYSPSSWAATEGEHGLTATPGPSRYREASLPREGSINNQRGGHSPHWVHDPAPSLTPRGSTTTLGISLGGPGGRLRSATPGPAGRTARSDAGGAFSYAHATPRTSMREELHNRTLATHYPHSEGRASLREVSRALESSFEQPHEESRPVATSVRYAAPPYYSQLDSTALFPHESQQRQTRAPHSYSSAHGPVTFVTDDPDLDATTSFERPGSPARTGRALTTALLASAVTDGRVSRTPSMVKDPLRAFLPDADPRDAGRLVVVLDLDETLIYAREGRTVVRPGCRELLQALKGRCELLVWTAGERDYAQGVIREIDGVGAVQHCVYRHPKWWTGRPGYTKNLLALGRPLNRTIIIDNTPDCLRDHPQHSLLVGDFLGKGDQFSDTTLFTVRRILEELIMQPHRSVPELLREHPEVVMRVVRCDTGGAIDVFTLAKDAHLGTTAYTTARRNFDLLPTQSAPSYSTAFPSTRYRPERPPYW